MLPGVSGPALVCWWQQWTFGDPSTGEFFNSWQLFLGMKAEADRFWRTVPGLSPISPGFGHHSGPSESWDCCLLTDNRKGNLEVWVKWQSCHGCLWNDSFLKERKDNRGEKTLRQLRYPVTAAGRGFFQNSFRCILKMRRAKCLLQILISVLIGLG